MIISSPPPACVDVALSDDHRRPSLIPDIENPRQQSSIAIPSMLRTSAGSTGPALFDVVTTTRRHGPAERQRQPDEHVGDHQALDRLRELDLDCPGREAGFYDQSQIDPRASIRSVSEAILFALHPLDTSSSTS